ncbi:hypothetical protein VP01_1824g5 [Puccinia sorghi]|uniref:Uncharacterized protein n=1 Tax=Puccinia sorghi TaxID=27349 RepID=A0A0L6VDZ6_9BASI|nr:hypothetical protein VP01_1824g5 [Puccinia sorghi]
MNRNLSCYQIIHNDCADKTSSHYTTPVAPLSQSQIFSSLIPLIQPSLYTACELYTKLLSSHAAHCMYINPTEDRVCLESDDAKWVTCINGLTLAVHRGLVTMRDAGELTANLIWIREINQTIMTSDKKK